MKLPTTVRVTEVGPRDGLQNEKAPIPTATKIAFVNQLIAAGFPEVEVTSFVSPKWVPQLADAAEVFAGMTRQPGVICSALVPNERGLEGALAAGADKVAVFTAASETFSQRNTNATIAETIERFRPVVERARAADLPVRGYVSCVVACPYDGPVEPAAVRTVAQQLLDIGVDEIDLGDTIGVAVPTDIDRLLDGVAGVVDPSAVTLHLHDTRRTALACVHRALQLGVTSFDSSCGGLGGCPYAPGAAGNLATEDLLYLCHAMGIETGVDADAVAAASRLLAPGRRDSDAAEA